MTAGEEKILRSRRKRHKKKEALILRKTKRNANRNSAMPREFAYLGRIKGKKNEKSAVSTSTMFIPKLKGADPNGGV